MTLVSLFKKRYTNRWIDHTKRGNYLLTGPSLICQFPQHLQAGLNVLDTEVYGFLVFLNDICASSMIVLET